MKRITRRDFLRKTLGATALMATSPWECIPTVIKGSAQAMQSSLPPCGPLGGTIIDAMEAVGGWVPHMGANAKLPTLTAVPGYIGQAVQLNYELATTTKINNYAQMRRDFNLPCNVPPNVPPCNWSVGDHIRFFHQGTVPNSLEIGLVADDGNYFASLWKIATHVHPGWTYATWDFQDFRKDGKPFPSFSQVKGIFISVVNLNDDDKGGQGSFAVDELQYLNLASRPVPSTLEYVTADPKVIQQAAAWIAAQQQSGGLLRSWQEDPADNAWLYDQALGLIVLAETDLPKATQLAHKLHTLQNADGSWYAGYYYMNDVPIRDQNGQLKEPVGAIAWTVYALVRYYVKSGDLMASEDALKGADWLAHQQRPDGSLPGELGDGGAPTEANLDTWWAFQSTGRHQSEADLLKNFLLIQVWDSMMGRFKSTANTYSDHPYQIFLDNQTWGAAFLRAVGREESARRALSYAHWTLATISRDGRICGFDGAGPFSVWNEGTLQYIAAHGENSQYYWNQMVSQQATDGGLPGSPEPQEFRGYSVWLTPWHGVAPTAWLYFAGTGGPFA